MPSNDDGIAGENQEINSMTGIELFVALLTHWASREFFQCQFSVIVFVETIKRFLSFLFFAFAYEFSES